MKRKIIWIAALLLGIMVACEDDEENTVQPANEVWMSETAFLPAQLVVSQGTTVRWVNNSNVPHTVTSTTGLFDEMLAVNGTFSFTFNEPGTFLYICTLHPGMEGSITVQATEY